MSQSTLSLEIGDRLMRLADIQSGKPPKILSLTEAISNPNFYSSETEKIVEAQAKELNKLVFSSKTKRRVVRIVIPDSYTFSQVLQIPRLNEKEMYSAIRYQADQFIPMPIEDITLDIELLHEDVARKQNTILVVACPKKIVQQIEKTVEMAGLFPENLENQFSALFRLTSQLTPHNSGMILVVNFGFKTTSLYLFDTKKSTAILRTIKVGFELMMRDVMFNLNIDEQKATKLLETIGFASSTTSSLRTYLEPIVQSLVVEIQKMTYLAKDTYSSTILHLYACNQFNLVKGLDEEIHSQIHLPVTPYFTKNLFVQDQVMESREDILSSFAAPIAAAW